MKPLSLIPKKQTQQIESAAALDTYWSLTTDSLLMSCIYPYRYPTTGL